MKKLVISGMLSAISIISIAKADQNFSTSMDLQNLLSNNVNKFQVCISTVVKGGGACTLQTTQNGQFTANFSTGSNVITWSFFDFNSSQSPLLILDSTCQNFGVQQEHTSNLNGAWVTYPNNVQSVNFVFTYNDKNHTLYCKTN